MRLTRRYRFAASHRLHSPQLDEQQNRETYGKCNNPYGHGHNYVLEVSVQGVVDASTGRVMAVEDLDAIVSEAVLSVYDGKNMNVDIDSFTGDVVPTTENVSVDVMKRLRAHWPAVGEAWRHTPRMPELAGVRLFETPRNVFDIEGEAKHNE